MNLIYRSPAHSFAEPAPYLNPNEDCPLCGACPALLYYHDEDCAWWVRYLAAGKRMRPLTLRGFLVEPRPGTDKEATKVIACPLMTDDEYRAVLELAPGLALEPKQSLWARLRGVLT